MPSKNHFYDKVVYLMQGGGALGSYQVGVCQALIEYGIHPDWVVGTSIGAINSAIIAGNEPSQRIAKLKEFWSKIAYPLPLFPIMDNFAVREYINGYCAQMIAMFGLPGFFKPRSDYAWLNTDTTPDKISFYDTSELKQTLLSVIDFDLLNKKKIRITLSAVNAENGKNEYFDNYHQIIGPEHVMASGALPPGFPAIKIDDQYYWDGGISSNTPFSVVLEEKVPQKLLCFIINLFSYRKHLPSNMMSVIKSKKEIEYHSRHQEILRYFCEIHYLQRTLQSLANDSNAKDLHQVLNKIKQIGHPTALNIVRFHYLDRKSDLWSKDFNFSHLILAEHEENGYDDATKALEDTWWLEEEFDQNDSGTVMHDFSDKERSTV